jgi:hypothetical protein
MTAYRFRLITNLDFVICGPVRTFSHALVLQTGPGLFDREKPEYRIRGFTTDASSPTFDIHVKSIEYTADQAASRDVFIGNDGEPRPLMSGAIFKFADGGPELQLVTSDYKRPLDIMDFEGEPRQCWDMLLLKAAEYWTGPNMPTLRWLPAASVRRALAGGLL